MGERSEASGVRLQTTPLTLLQFPLCPLRARLFTNYLPYNFSTNKTAAAENPRSFLGRVTKPPCLWEGTGVDALCARAVTFKPADVVKKSNAQILFLRSRKLPRGLTDGVERGCCRYPPRSHEATSTARSACLALLAGSRWVVSN